jgi:DNA-binding IclR family transcriptional regulator
VLEALDETPTPFETLLLRTDLSVAEAAQACEHLVEQGMVETGAGWWSRRS